MFSKSKKQKEAQELLSQGAGLLKYDDSANFSDQILTKGYEVFTRAAHLFKKLGDEGKDGEQTCEGYLRMIEGFRHRKNDEWIESMKAFGRANVQFSAGRDDALATKVRVEQGRAQMDFAKKKALEGDFPEAARLYESAGAVFQMVSLDKDAAEARAKAYVQRAAQVKDDFEKAGFLAKAVDEFRKSRKSNEVVEAHALFYRGRSLLNVKVRDALQMLTRAQEKYERVGASEQAKRVREIIEQVNKGVLDHAGESGQLNY